MLHALYSSMGFASLMRRYIGIAAVCLQGIATTWAGLELDMAEYKATYKLRSTEEVFAALEDNMVTLSTMKASRFFAVFEKDITHWEKTLSLVSETIELVLTVSANWPCSDSVCYPESTQLCQQISADQW